jgi:hypothetical protein
MVGDLISTLFSLSSSALVTDARLRAEDASGEARNWLSHGRGYTEQRFSPLDQIDNETVSRLGLAWRFDVGSRLGMQTTPLAEPDSRRSSDVSSSATISRARGDSSSSN